MFFFKLYLTKYTNTGTHKTILQNKNYNGSSFIYFLKIIPILKDMERTFIKTKEKRIRHSR